MEPVLTNLVVGQVLPRQQLSVYPDLPLVRGFQEIQAPQQRGFSASRGADDGKHLPPLHGKADTLEDIGVAEALFDIFYFQNRHTLNP